MELLDQRYPQNMPVLMVDSNFDHLFSSLLFTLSCMKEISGVSLQLLQLLLQLSFESSNQAFFNRCFLQVLENAIGLIIDKDTKQNHQFASKYLTKLFSTAFKNIMKNSLSKFWKREFLKTIKFYSFI